MHSVFRVSIVGKANVGKSTLFNKLTKQRLSITMDRKGVTRDVLEKKVSLQNGESFLLLDTAGFNPKRSDTIDRTQYAIKKSEIILFVIDDKIDAEDLFFVSWLRKNAGNSRIILVRNKIDCKNKDDCSVFGFKEVFQISAEHSTGIQELLAYIESSLPQRSSSEDFTEKIEEKFRKIRITILGQPNVGKSTLMNKFMGTDRVLVSPEAGTTRDPVNDEFLWNGHTIFEFIDTAGLRKKRKVSDKLESVSNSRALQASAESDVILFMYDVSNFTLEKQDFILINRVLENGKPVILIGNKKDAVKNADLKNIQDFIKLQGNKLLLERMPTFFISSLRENDFSVLLEECSKLYDSAKKHIPKHKLNRWLQEVINKHPHPIVNSKSVKLKYITKVKDKFSFLIRANHPDLVADSYLNYIKNSLAKDFQIYGIPIKFVLEKNKNPYATERSVPRESQQFGTAPKSIRKEKIVDRKVSQSKNAVRNRVTDKNRKTLKAVPKQKSPLSKASR
ncbi:ribosome-associated GTPase EngA [Neorickettsia helminthoeca str. Oregon]|uniref:GTPase Der n=1 Tax=Neorickettsia helminthoeca str. Oregon TaxID=1286528 RepID=X5H4G5_9RICK|nr:ribosome biogenesis GTPase Der [Neorickettsia helminthoeca]AHX11456.1 ribosome-associated GTPase EngA [Neorickettsia helminthoeca str. Oregon]